MTQYVINIGAIPNDGTGDPLRTAFNETNLNFDQVFAAGPVLSNIQIANNKILTTNTNGNLVLAPNGTGVVQANVSIVPNLANLRNLGSSTQRWATVYTQYLNVSAGTSINGDLSVAGNLTVQGNIIQVGNIVTDSLTIQLANTATTANAANGSGITVGLNDDIATLLYNSAGNVWAMNIGLNTPNIVVNNISSDDSTFVTIQDGLDVQGDITAETVNTAGNITGGNLLAPGAVITTNFQGGNLQVTGNANASYVYAQGSISTAGFISASGNITGNYIIGNGSQLTGLAASYGNANVATFMAAFGSNTISTAGNITSNYYVGNVAVLAGQNIRGEHAANLGASGFTELNSNVILQITGNANSYAQINFQNIGNGTAATTDYIATAQFGTDSTYFVDMGIASGTYDSSNPDNSLGNSLYAQDSYLYAMGGNSYGGSGGNLVVGSNEPGGVVRIIADGSTTDNIVATFSNVGVDVKGNINFNGGGITQVLNEDFVIVASDDENDGWSIYNVVDDGTGNTFTDTRLSNDQFDIRTNVQGASPYTWSFRDSGQLDLPGDIAGNVGGNLTVKIGDQAGSDTFIDLQTRSYVGDALISNIRIANPNVTISTASGANTWTFDSIGNLTLPGATAGETIATQGGYITVGNLLIGQGGALFNSNNDSWALYGNLSDPGATIFIPSNADAGNGTALYIESQQSNVEIRSGSGTWNFDSTGNLTVPGNILTGGIVSATGNITGGNIVTAGNVSGNTAGFAIGYRDIPQVSFTGNATIATTDAGKHYYSTLSTGNVLTIANNASQGFQVGAAITVVNQGTGNITVAQGSGVTLYLAGNATSGNRSVATFGMATLIKVATDTWFINGTGVS